jgi:hypothetical protein
MTEDLLKKERPTMTTENEWVAFISGTLAGVFVAGFLVWLVVLAHRSWQADVQRENICSEYAATTTIANVPVACKNYW